MFVLFGRRWLAVPVCFALFGCDSGGAPIAADDRPSAGGASAGPGCSLGTPCNCGNGVYGLTRCEPVESCDCADCPEFEPDVRPEFETCPGTVLGDWSLESAEFYLEPLRFSSQSLGSRECPMQVVAAPQDVRLNLSVPTRGHALFDISGFAFATRYLDACSAPFVGAACAGVDEACKLIGCGVCECPTIAFSAQRSDSSLISLDSTTLSLKAESGAPVSFEYCLDDAHLTLNARGFTAKLRKVAFVGAPSACESREASDCELGAYCKWASGKCSGSALSSCLIQDFGVVPGCMVYAPDATCEPVESPEDCADHERASCVATHGCDWLGTCRGPSIDCQELWLRSGVCDTDAGCQKVDTENCAGTAECPKHTSQERCTELNQCSWVTGCGVPDAVPCNDYPLTECTTHKGCELVGTRLK